jgi:hypothetical protein
MNLLRAFSALAVVKFKEAGQGFSSSRISALYSAGLAGSGVSRLGYAGCGGSAAVVEPGQVAASLLLLGGYAFLNRSKAAKATLVLRPRLRLGGGECVEWLEKVAGWKGQ